MSYLDDLKKKAQNIYNTAQKAGQTVSNVYNAAKQGAQNVYNAATGNTQKPTAPTQNVPNTQPSAAAIPEQNQQQTDWAAEYDKVMSGAPASTGAAAPVTAQPAQNVSPAAQATLGAGAGGWQAELDKVMSQIMGQGTLEYNMNGDAMYQQYADIYQNQANLGMQNAMAQAAAMTGGYGSSYGQMVGQQAYAQQMQGLNDIGLELYDRAYAQDQAERSQLMDQYNMLAAREEQAYNRGIDDRNFEYQQGRDETADSQWQQSFDYNKYLDELEQSNYEKEFEYQQGRDTVADEQWNKQFASNEEQRAEDNAYRDEAFEYTKEQDKIAQEQWKAELDRALANDKISQEQWQSEMDRLNANDKTAQDQWQQSFDYTKYLDELEQKNFDKQFEYQKDRDSVADDQWNKQYESNEDQRQKDNAYRDETLEYTKEQDKQAQENWQAELDRMLANDEISQQQWQAEMDRALENDKTAKEQWQAGMDQQSKEFDSLYGYTDENGNKVSGYYEEMADKEFNQMYGPEGYMTKKDEQDQKNWDAQFKREGEQWNELYGEGGYYDKQAVADRKNKAETATNSSGETAATRAGVSRIDSKLKRVKQQGHTEGSPEYIDAIEGEIASLLESDRISEAEANYLIIYYGLDEIDD